jgi:thiamine-monophosphate kinase
MTADYFAKCQQGLSGDAHSGYQTVFSGSIKEELKNQVFHRKGAAPHPISASRRRAILLMMRQSEEKQAAGGELALLRQIRQRAVIIRSPNVQVGIGDDCAVLRLRRDEEMVVTTDLSLEGRHFRLDWHSPEVVGHRTLARGLSDLAAMGARPVAAFLSLAVPKKLTAPGQRGKAWTERFYDGLLSLAETYKTQLAGGDLAEFPQVLADIVLVGAVRQGRALLRSGAKPGDEIYVTGTLGGAAAGLRALEALRGKKPPARLTDTLKPHLYPEPRITQGLWLARHSAVTAAMDLSDGLSIDLARLCEESGVAAEIDESSLPIASGATIDDTLHGGEDYELLFTAKPGTKLPRSSAGIPVTQVGRIVKRRTGKPQVALSTASGAIPLQPRGWQHFTDQSRRNSGK